MLDSQMVFAQHFLHAQTEIMGRRRFLFLEQCCDFNLTPYLFIVGGCWI